MLLHFRYLAFNVGDLFSLLFVGDVVAFQKIQNIQISVEGLFPFFLELGFIGFHQQGLKLRMVNKHGKSPAPAVDNFLRVGCLQNFFSPLQHQKCRIGGTDLCSFCFYRQGAFFQTVQFRFEAGGHYFHINILECSQPFLPVSAMGAGFQHHIEMADSLADTGNTNLSIWMMPHDLGAARYFLQLPSKPFFFLFSLQFYFLLLSFRLQPGTFRAFFFLSGSLFFRGAEQQPPAPLPKVHMPSCSFGQYAAFTDW